MIDPSTLCESLELVSVWFNKSEIITHLIWAVFDCLSRKYVLFISRLLNIFALAFAKNRGLDHFIEIKQFCFSWANI